MEENKIQVTKLESARRQLETAIKLFFAGGDFVSIHALSYAAYGITRDLCDHSNNPTFFDRWIGDRFDKTRRDDFFKQVSEAAGFFKHADREPTKILEYTLNQYELFLIIAVFQYEALTSELTLPMGVFKIWFMKNRPGLLVEFNEQEKSQLLKETSLPLDKASFYDLVSQHIQLAERNTLKL
jgi:hypothetical protein